MRDLLSEVDLLSTLDRTNVGVGQIVYPPGSRFGPRWQHQLELVFVHTGSARIRVDDREPVTVPAGWVALQLPQRRELYLWDEQVPTHHSWIEFELEDWPEALLERFAALPTLLPTSGALHHLVTEAIAIAGTPLSTSGPLVASLAMAAVWRYVGEAESSLRGPDDAVERARSFLHAHVSDPRVDLQMVARAAHVSAPHLVRRFRKELGVTPMAYLWQRRVTTGIDLLTSTGLPIGDVAMRSGFTSVYHFSRRVKAHTGSSPTAVRQGRWSR